MLSVAGKTRQGERDDVTHVSGLQLSSILVPQAYPVGFRYAAPVAVSLGVLSSVSAALGVSDGWLRDQSRDVFDGSWHWNVEIEVNIGF